MMKVMSHCAQLVIDCIPTVVVKHECRVPAALLPDATSLPVTESTMNLEHAQSQTIHGSKVCKYHGAVHLFILAIW